MNIDAIKSRFPVWQTPDKAITLVNADCREVLPMVEKGSIDLCLTDPPYHNEHIHLYEESAQAIKHALKHGAFVFYYCGAGSLDKYIAGITKHLTWFWLFNIKHNCGAPRYWCKKIMVTSKPVMAFTNGAVQQKDLRWCGVDCDDEKQDKDYHEWGQSPGFAIKQIELRTQLDGLVCDPFLGGGTVGAACIQTGRRFLGIELAKEHYETACLRCRTEYENKTATGGLFQAKLLETK